MHHVLVSSEFSDLFDEFFGPKGLVGELLGGLRRGRAVSEKNCSTITMDLPGRKKEDVSVTVKDRRLTVSVKALKRTNSSGVEFESRPAITESWQLSPNHVVSEVACKLEDGVLTIKVPIRQPAETDARTIPVG